MSNIKAFIVGVSDYSHFPEDKQLPFCRNDIIELQNTLVNAINVSERDIFILGETGNVSHDEFLSTLLNFIESVDADDTLVFYYSGHGCTVDNKHYLVITDTTPNIRATAICTSDITSIIETCQAKSKIIFLDCCEAGGLFGSTHVDLMIDEAVEEFAGKGYDIFASCGALEYSYKFDETNISTFTYFLCLALRSKSIIKEGRMSLYDLKELVTLYINKWSKRKGMSQYPVFKSHMVGTMYFEIEDYQPYYYSSFQGHETDAYKIVEIQPIHRMGSKRYTVSVIFKKQFNYHESYSFIKQITDYVKFVEVYKSESSKSMWFGKPADIVCLYIGQDEFDIQNGLWMIRSVWIDDKLDKEYHIRTFDGESEKYQGIKVHLEKSYTENKTLLESFIGKASDVIATLNTIKIKMVNFAEQAKNLFNQYIGKEIDEEQLFREITFLGKEVRKLFLLDFPAAPNEIKSYSDTCSLLFGSIDEMFVYYNESNRNRWNTQSRITLMDLAIKGYYKDLESLKKITGR